MLTQAATVHDSFIPVPFVFPSPRPFANDPVLCSIGSAYEVNVRIASLNLFRENFRHEVRERIRHCPGNGARLVSRSSWGVVHTALLVVSTGHVCSLQI